MLRLVFHRLLTGSEHLAAIISHSHSLIPVMRHHLLSGLTPSKSGSFGSNANPALSTVPDLFLNGLMCQTRGPHASRADLSPAWLQPP